MKKLILSLALTLISCVVASQTTGAKSTKSSTDNTDVVKLSKSGICHAPNTVYYEKTKNFTPYKTLDECIKAGGRLPKK